jgi:hypothetical protein
MSGVVHADRRTHFRRMAKINPGINVATEEGVQPCAQR